jgi:hypothetical protein
MSTERAEQKAEHAERLEAEGERDERRAEHARERADIDEYVEGPPIGQMDEDPGSGGMGGG